MGRVSRRMRTRRRRTSGVTGRRRTSRGILRMYRAMSNVFLFVFLFFFCFRIHIQSRPVLCNLVFLHRLKLQRINCVRSPLCLSVPI
jgi:hypothetical protein